MSEDSTNASVTSASEADIQPAVAATEQEGAVVNSGQAASGQAASGANNAAQVQEQVQAQEQVQEQVQVQGQVQGQSLSPQPLAAVEKMEVEVDFEVGRVTLPVSALASIAQGAVIDIGVVALDNVTAKSGGVAFAHGEFVELGGRVGFRITRLFGEQDKP